ncbi:MAG: hypothetical protein Q8O76_11680, partial [Chloroflexota bacterium]|nr:hypothetical protein [Chloroflexota bacterium]
MKVFAERILGGSGGCGDLGEPFRVCFQCGECCSRYQVRLTLVEARRIADALGIAWHQFLDE